MSGAKTALAVAAYAALIVSLATTPSGGEDWTLVALLAVAHLGLGWAVARAWALLLPIALCVGTFLAAGASGLDWLVLFLGLPVLVAVTAAGLLLLSCGLYGEVIRLLPPVTIGDAELAEGLDVLEASLKAAAG